MAAVGDSATSALQAELQRLRIQLARAKSDHARLMLAEEDTRRELEELRQAKDEALALVEETMATGERQWEEHVQMSEQLEQQSRELKALALQRDEALRVAGELEQGLKRQRQRDGAVAKQAHNNHDEAPAVPPAQPVSADADDAAQRPWDDEDDSGLATEHARVESMAGKLAQMWAELDEAGARLHSVSQVRESFAADREEVFELARQQDALSSDGDDTDVDVAHTAMEASADSHPLPAASPHASTVQSTAPSGSTAGSGGTQGHAVDSVPGAHGHDAALDAALDRVQAAERRAAELAQAVEAERAARAAQAAVDARNHERYLKLRKEKTKAVALVGEALASQSRMADAVKASSLELQRAQDASRLAMRRAVALEEDVVSLRKQLVAAENTRSALLQEHKAQVAALQAQLTSAREELDERATRSDVELSTQQHRAEEEAATLRQSLSDALESGREARGRVAGLASERRDLMAQRDELATQLRAEQAAMSKLSIKLSAIKDSEDTLKRGIAQLKAEKVSLEEKVERLQEKATGERAPELRLLSHGPHCERTFLQLPVPLSTKPVLLHNARHAKSGSVGMRKHKASAIRPWPGYSSSLFNLVSSALQAATARRHRRHVRVVRTQPVWATKHAMVEVLPPTIKYERSRSGFKPLPRTVSRLQRTQWLSCRSSMLRSWLAFGGLRTIALKNCAGGCWQLG